MKKESSKEVAPIFICFGLGSLEFAVEVAPRVNLVTPEDVLPTRDANWVSDKPGPGSGFHLKIDQTRLD